MLARMLAAPAGSNPAVGSSRINTLGSMAMTPAMATRRFLPAGEFEGGACQDLIAQAGKGSRLAYPAVNLWLIQLHVPGAEGDVFVHCLLEQLVFRILEHQPHLKADVVGQLFAAPDVLPLEEDLPLCGADQPVQVLDQGWTCRNRCVR